MAHRPAFRPLSQLRPVHRDLEIPVGDPVADRRFLLPQAPPAAIPRAQVRLRPLQGAIRGNGHPRQLPGSGQELAVVGPPEEQHAAVVLDHGDQQPVPFRLALHPRRRVPLGVPPGRGPAAGGERTEEALGAARGAEGSAQLHEGLVAVARALRIEQGRSRSQESLAGGAPLRVRVESQPAGEDALDVAVEHRLGDAEGDARHCRRRVGPDPRQLAQPLDGPREPAELGDPPRRGMELPGSPVVAQARPEGEDLFEVCLRKGLGGGKFFQEPLVIGEHHLHARLLEHHFREPDAVGIARSAPGQVAAVPVEPGEEVLGMPHPRHSISGRPIWQARMAISARRAERSAEKENPPPRRGEGFKRGASHLSGWLIWLYPCQ